MSLDGVVPVTHVHRSARTVAQIHGDEAQVGGENDVTHIFLIITKLGLLPFMKLYAVGRLVTHLYIPSLHFLGPGGEIHKLLTASPRIGTQPGRAGVLLGINRIQRVKSLRVNRVTGHVLTPVIKSDSPGIGTVVGAEAGEAV